MKFPMVKDSSMWIEAIEMVTAARWRARAARARRFRWSVGEGDAHRLEQYAAECEAEARRLESEEEDEAFEVEAVSEMLFSAEFWADSGTTAQGESREVIG